MSAHIYRHIADLPGQIAVFPLPGAMLFPRWTLPLNIFEPRYLNMLDDIMAGERMLGMVQTAGGDRERPALARVGCAGRVTSFDETDDGRYLIALSGICRFEVREDVDVRTPYRQVRPGWSPYEADLHPPARNDLPSRDLIVAALKSYVLRNDMSAGWAAVADAPVENLIHALCAGCPFGIQEKQALLEAPTLMDRAEVLLALLAMDLPGPGSGNMQ